jgi:hypothetical protein
MLDETNPYHQNASLRYCKIRFGHYGLFATLPLRAAIISTDNGDLISFKSSLEFSWCNAGSSAKLAEYIRDLGFDDCDFFNIEEYRFLIQLLSPCTPLSDEQLESDRRKLLREVKQRKNILKSHAEMLLKAIMFWRLRYHNKYDGWMEKFIAADMANELRWKLKAGIVSPGEAVLGIICPDDGYESDITPA